MPSLFYNNYYNTTFNTYSNVLELFVLQYVNLFGIFGKKSTNLMKHIIYNRAK